MEVIDALILTAEQFYQIGIIGAAACACLLVLLALFALTALVDGLSGMVKEKPVREPPARKHA